MSNVTIICRNSLRENCEKTVILVSGLGLNVATNGQLRRARTLGKPVRKERVKSDFANKKLSFKFEQS